MSKWFAPVIVVISIVTITLSLVSLLASGPEPVRAHLALAALILAGTSLVLAAIAELTRPR